MHSFEDSPLEHFQLYTDFDLEGMPEDFVDSPVVDSVGGTDSVVDMGLVADTEFLGTFADNL